MPALIARTHNLQEMQDFLSLHGPSLISPTKAFMTAQTELLLDSVAERIGITGRFGSPNEARDTLYVAAQIVANSVAILLDKTAAEESTRADYSAGVRFAVLSFEQDWRFRLAPPPLANRPAYGFRYLLQGSPEVVDCAINYAELLQTVISSAIQAVEREGRVEQRQVIERIQRELLPEELSGSAIEQLTRVLRIRLLHSDVDVSYAEFKASPEHRRFRGEHPEDLVTEHTIEASVFDEDGNGVSLPPQPFEQSSVPDGMQLHHEDIREHALASWRERRKRCLEEVLRPSPIQTWLLSFPDLKERARSLGLAKGDPGFMAAIALSTLRTALTAPQWLNIETRFASLDEAIQGLPEKLEARRELLQQCQRLLATRPGHDEQGLNGQIEDIELILGSLGRFTPDQLRGLWARTFGG